MNLSVKAYKALLITVNIFIAFIGLGLLAVGCVLKFTAEMLDGYLAPIVKMIPAGGGTGSDVWTLYNYTTVYFIVFGIIIVFIAVSGCIVGTCPNQISAVVFLASLGFTVLTQILGLAILGTTNIDSTLKETLKDHMLRKYAGDEAFDEYSQALNYAFIEFDCCAVESYQEFFFTVRWDREKNISGVVTAVTIPTTCCKLSGDYPNQGSPYDVNCTTNPTEENSNYLKGCYEPLKHYLWYYHMLMILCEAAPLLFEVAAIVLAVFVISNLRRNKEKGFIAIDD